SAIVDDIGAILVVALFYSEGVQIPWLLAAAFFTVLLAMLNRSGVYRVTPYIAVGIALWAAVHSAGLHATLPGLLPAACIPARPRRDQRSADEPHGAPVAHVHPALELRRAAFVRARKCRRRAVGHRVRRARAADARDRGRPRRRQAGRLSARVRARRSARRRG